MKIMRSKADTIKEISRRECGQVITEYVIVLAVTLTLVLALVFLMRAIGENGELSVERISAPAP